MRSTRRCITTGVAAAVLIGATAGPAGAEDGAEAAEIAAAVVAATGTEDLATAVAADADSSLITEDAGTVIDIPLDPADGVAITTESGERLGIGIPGDGEAADVSGATVVYADAAPSAAAAAQATEDGGVRVLVTLTDAHAAAEYRFPLDLPEGAVPTLREDGVVDIVAGDGTALGSIAPAWAKDAGGSPLPSSYRLEGTTLIQDVVFDESTAFPVVIDPWWNPLSWNWSKIGRATVKGLKNCGVGALAGVVGTGTATLTTNVIRDALGRTMIRVAGGPWGYVGFGVGGCVAKLIGG